MSRLTIYRLGLRIFMMSMNNVLIICGIACELLSAILFCYLWAKVIQTVYHSTSHGARILICVMIMWLLVFNAFAAPIYNVMLFITLIIVTVYGRTHRKSRIFKVFSDAASQPRYTLSNLLWILVAVMLLSLISNGLAQLYFDAANVYNPIKIIHPNWLRIVLKYITFNWDHTLTLIKL